jgi:hypothetical protein
MKINGALWHQSGGHMTTGEEEEQQVTFDFRIMVTLGNCSYIPNVMLNRLTEAL